MLQWVLLKIVAPLALISLIGVFSYGAGYMKRGQIEQLHQVRLQRDAARELAEAQAKFQTSLVTIVQAGAQRETHLRSQVSNVYIPRIIAAAPLDEQALPADSIGPWADAIDGVRRDASAARADLAAAYTERFGALPNPDAADQPDAHGLGDILGRARAGAGDLPGPERRSSSGDPSAPSVGGAARASNSALEFYVYPVPDILPRSQLSDIQIWAAGSSKEPVLNPA